MILIECLEVFLLLVLRVYLVNLSTDGRVRTDDKTTCECCGATGVCYRITDRGRVYLADRRVEA